MSAPAASGCRRRRLPVAWCLVATAALALAGLLLGLGTAPAGGQAEVAVVTVVAGKPTEFAFKLSKSIVAPGQAWGDSMRVTFKVTNRGARAHGFKVCAAPVASARLNACEGTATKQLAPGQSATMTFVCTERGAYEYLSTNRAEAAKGMKGLIRIGVGPPATTTSRTPTTPAAPAAPGSPSTPSSPSPPAPAPSLPVNGDAVAGATVWTTAGCGSCHSLAQVKGYGIAANLNVMHPGPFDNGPLTATQIGDLAAYVARAGG